MAVVSSLPTVRRIIEDELGCAPDFADDATLESLGADSLDCVSLAMKVEDHFNLDVELDELEDQPMTPAAIAAVVDEMIAAEIPF